MNIFYRDYSAKAAHLRDEFAKRGIKDKNLDMLYKNPTNYIGMRELSTSIAFLSEKL